MKRWTSTPEGWKPLPAKGLPIPKKPPKFAAGYGRNCTPGGRPQRKTTRRFIMARTKSNELAIKTLEEADDILREMCRIEEQIEAVDNTADEKIAKIKEAAAKEGKPLRDRYKSMVKTLEAYARYFRGELFKDRKSMERPFGSFGFRKAPDAVSVSKETAELLKKHGFAQYIRTKVEPDKEAMLALDDDTLALVGAARKQKEDFFIETRLELVNQELAKRGA
jgi:phage host-nuclease inhibitor protein Gam